MPKVVSSDKSITMSALSGITLLGSHFQNICLATDDNAMYPACIVKAVLKSPPVLPKRHQLFRLFLSLFLSRLGLTFSRA